MSERPPSQPPSSAARPRLDLLLQRLMQWSRYKALVLSVAAFIIAAALALAAATASVRFAEHVVERDVAAALAEADITWAEHSADGLLLTLVGEAPTESERFRALGIVGTVVSAERVIDNLTVAASVAVAPPRFALEMMRNNLDVQLIGLVPETQDMGNVTRRIEALGPEVSVVNLVESAAHPVPFGWERSLDFALEALALVPISKISVAADQVEIFGLAASQRERDRFREELQRKRPSGVIASIEISAPRPVIAPFTLRVLKDDSGMRFDACSADTEEARRAILQAARLGGAEGTLECQIGLGSPSARWQAAVVAAIRALEDVEQGIVTFSDTDITLELPYALPNSAFDAIVGALESRLPDVFSLRAERLPALNGDAGADDDSVEFVASRTPDGLVVLRGRLTDERLSNAVLALARAEFGPDTVDMHANIDAATPEGWSMRSLLAVDALARLEHGTVVMRPDRFDIRGASGDPNASDALSQLMSEKLGQGARFNLDVRYDESLDPVAMQPTPARCEDWIQAILDERMITFEPGSTTIEGPAIAVMDDIAEVLRECGRLELEIAGHTDSQGRLETNMRLSQQRADAVLGGLLERGIPVSGFKAKGYGPEFPIASNDTEDGREKNRRIEFRLIGESAEAARVERGEDTEPEEVELPDESELDISVSAPEEDTPRPQPRPAN